MPDSTVTIGGDISDLQTKLKQAGGSIQSFGDKSRASINGMFSGAGAGLAGLLPSASVAATVGGLRSILNGMDNLADTALRLRESTETLQRVEYASTLLAGVDLGGLTTSFLRLEKSIGDVENAAANQALERYGVTAEGLARLSLDEKVVTIAEAFQQARQDGTGYNDLLALLGKSAGDLIPLFETSGQTIRAAFADAPVILDGTVQKMAAMNDQVDAFIAKQKGGITDFITQGLMMVDEILDPNKTLGQNTRDATAGADQTVADQAAKREQAAAALAVATADQRIKREAANEATRLLGIARELEAVDRMRLALGERQFANLMHHLTPALQIQAIENRIGQEMQRQIDLREQGPVDEATEITNAEKMLTLEEQLAKAKQARADAAAAAATKEQAATEKLMEQVQNLADMQARTEILKAQAGGDDKKAAALQREVDIEQAKRAILDQVAVSEAEALRMAQEQISLKEKIAANEAEGKDGKGKIDASIAPGGADAARARAEERVNRSRDRVNSTMSDSFGSFAGEDARLKSKFSDQFGTVGGVPVDRQNPAAVQAGKNADAAKPPTTGSETTTALELIRGILETLKA